MLPPTYTVFGTIDATGLATLDKIAAGGVADGERRRQARQGRDDHVGSAGLRGSALGRPNLDGGLDADSVRRR